MEEITESHNSKVRLDYTRVCGAGRKFYRNCSSPNGTGFHFQYLPLTLSYENEYNLKYCTRGYQDERLPKICQFTTIPNTAECLLQQTNLWVWYVKMSCTSILWVLSMRLCVSECVVKYFTGEAAEISTDFSKAIFLDSIKHPIF